MTADPAPGLTADSLAPTAGLFLRLAALQAADKAWLVLLAYVLGYNLSAHKGQTLSEGCDRYLAGHRWATEAALGLLYAHLSNRVPPRYDPIHLVFAGAFGARRLLYDLLTGRPGRS